MLTKTQTFQTLAFLCALLIFVLINLCQFKDGSDIIFKDDTNKTKTPQRKLLLFIAIFSSHTYKHRRDMLRKTWCKLCMKHQLCEYRFILDGLGLDRKPLPSAVLNQIRNELRYTNDMAILASPIGLNFALRFYKALKYASQVFEFEYFLRLDDDQYLCLDRLMYELPSRPRESLFWGYAHCTPIPRIDEAFIILTNDVVFKILTNENIHCSPFGTEAISSWIYNLSDEGPLVTWYTDNFRIMHTPPFERSAHLRQVNICHAFISLHGIWRENIMVPLHERIIRENTEDYEIPDIHHLCPANNKRISLDELDKHGKVQRCIDAPVYKHNNGKPYIGREAAT
ncbi:uncharacterized protein LOC130647245 [Hydractinia symbiolongicarpus]|uniref:uncharacterized protein LOC130647245 n=1 Tax=Hydractinia symbiolongicarpus TaxID=13093 RepID=UPI00254F4730|nr:uncharacterized protein LOC130647245 [Hydractinia symbiolongicarpus]